MTSIKKLNIKDIFILGEPFGKPYVVLDILDPKLPKKNNIKSIIIAQSLNQEKCFGKFYYEYKQLFECECIKINKKISDNEFKKRIKQAEQDEEF